MGMERKLKIDTGGVVFGPYSPGINVKDHIWLSGQVDVSVEGIEAQTRGTLAKIDDLLSADVADGNDVNPSCPLRGGREWA